MGWLFGKKKVLPKVPFPEGFSAEEDTLHFPPPPSRERVIEPQQVKAAVGSGKFPQERDEPPLPSPFLRRVLPFSSPTPPSLAPHLQEPLYIKVEVYRSMLGELDSVRHDFNKLQTINSHLHSSEYNEEHNFTKLRKAVRGMHDRLLQVDKILCKG